MKLLKSAMVLTSAVLLILVGTSFEATAHGFGSAVSGGFMSGFIHVFGGCEHLLALLTVGVCSSQLGDKVERWMPIVLVVAMIYGALTATTAQALPGTYIGTAASVVILGVILTVTLTLRMPVAFALFSAFAIFHGFSHGAELAAGGNIISIGGGILAATLLLQLIGVCLGSLVRQQQVPLLARSLGIGCAVTGAFLFAV